MGYLKLERRCELYDRLAEGEKLARSRLLNSALGDIRDLPTVMAKILLLRNEGCILERLDATKIGNFTC